MKNRYFLSVALGIVAILFASCNDDKVSLNFKQDITVTIQGIVYDNNGHTPLSGVLVTLGADTVTTLADGYYSFEGNSSGSYLLKFSKENYMTMVQQVVEVAKEFTANSIVNTSPVFMYEKTETLTTSFYWSNGIEDVPLANMEVRLEILYDYEEPDYYGGEYYLSEGARVVETEGVEEMGESGIFFEDAVIVATTDDLGKISFTNLPNIEVHMSLRHEFDQKRFSFDRYELPSDYSTSYILYYNSATEFRLIHTNLTDEDGNQVYDFDPADNITFQFSEEVSYASATLHKNNVGVDVLVTVTTSGNTVTIDPNGTSLEPGVSYNVSLNVSSVLGHTYQTDIDFTVSVNSIVLTKVLNLNLDESYYSSYSVYESDNFVYIEFDSVAGASDYEIYGKYSGGTDEFVYLNTAYSEFEDVYVYLLNSGISVPEGKNGLFDGNTYTLIVRAVLDGAKGPFSDPLVISEGDNRQSPIVVR
ncbi:carboxypeptidase regulatory-like domain-containing protein [Reichenbachiella agarivorans]|uniref:Carboxypeptidase regulatory-like domain-containing protein n=1 Tax=Reichenbachiella agarivorans TaxID=2979464 RepID=A0ABY6CMQ6_9BACT|nr:carboxypeptidase regulatory-like domain-containing protein [Reichenbachiella agarivorans]UXP31781.1 carboxypeptidase regulatory-like domain-containing protein [Reichenbachiella agarivorans]